MTEPFPLYYPATPCVLCGTPTESPWGYAWLPAESVMVVGCRSCLAIEDWLAERRGLVAMAAECEGR